MEKSCSKCGDTKPVEGFSRDQQSKDGKRSRCRECIREYSAAHADAQQARSKAHYAANRDRYLAERSIQRAANREAHRERARAYSRTPAGKATAIRSQQRQREIHPDRIYARETLRYAVASGRMSRGPCEVCAATPTDGHHDDYSKPLGVRWLCARCHRAHHKQGEKT